MIRKILFILLVCFFVNASNAQNWQKLAAGGEFSLALGSDGAIWAWGFNANGQLGLGNTQQAFDTPQKVGEDTDWVDIAAGGFHTLAIKTDGTLWSWGLNTEGQGGSGNATQYTTSQQIGSASNWVAIAAGQSHSMALKENGTLWVWGYNAAGQLGDGTGVDRPEPIQIGDDEDWESIAAGGLHSLAIKTDGTLWTWGLNANGQLGLGDTQNRLEPTKVNDNTDWKEVVGGFEFSLGLKGDGTLKAWGYNFNGQLGTGNTTQNNNPTDVSIAGNITQIAAGAAFGLAINEDQKLYAWGANVLGELGLGNTDQTNTPEEVGGDDWIFVTAATGLVFQSNVYGLHTLALRGEAKSICVTGANYVAQLGNGGDDNLSDFSCTVGEELVPTHQLEQEILAQFELAPNPVEDILQVELKGVLDQETWIVLENIHGLMIKRVHVEGSNWNLDCSALPAGVYTIRLQQKNGYSIAKKLVKI